MLLGAVLFGIGMAVFGYCPGTSVVGCGEGRRDAMIGVLGMFAGAAMFVMFYEQLQPVIQALGDWGKITLPDITNTSPWIWVSLLVAGGTAALLWDRSHRKKNSPLLSQLVESDRKQL